MKIWIITYWNENLILTKLLKNVNIDIIYDSVNWPLDWKDRESSINSYLSNIDKLLEIWNENLILHPIFELAIWFYDHIQQKTDKYKNISDKTLWADWNSRSADSRFTVQLESAKRLCGKHDFWKYNKHITPIFTDYLLDFVAKYSLVWKLWIVWNNMETSQIEFFLYYLLSDYTPTDNQNKISKFHFPFKTRTKSVDMRDYMTNFLPKRKDFINKIIKTDCKYFRDANIDTLIPLQYSYFWYKRQLEHYFNPNKCRFHHITDIISTNSLAKYWIEPTYDTNEINLYFSWSDSLFYSNAKREKLLNESEHRKLNVFYSSKS